MKNLLRWILSVLGYGAYTLAVVIALLWFLFPAESLRVWLQAKLEGANSSLAWEIGELRMAWPLSVAGLDIKAVQKDTGESLLLIDELIIRPDVTGIVKLPEEWSVVYRARMFSGMVSGDVSLDSEQGLVACSGEITDLQIRGMDGVWQKLGRKGSGNLSGSFSCSGKMEGLLSGNLQADLALTDGSLEFLQPVFGMGSLAFNRLSTVLTLRDRVVTLEKGKIDSDLFGVEFGGTVTMADNLFGSGLDINGSFEPRPELLGGLKDPAVVKLIKGQLHEGKLTFSLIDTLLAPGMLFQGTSGVIDGLIQGSSR